MTEYMRSKLIFKYWYGFDDKMRSVKDKEVNEYQITWEANKFLNIQTDFIIKCQRFKTSFGSLCVSLYVIDNVQIGVLYVIEYCPVDSAPFWSRPKGTESTAQSTFNHIKLAYEHIIWLKLPSIFMSLTVSNTILIRYSFYH